VEVVEFDIGARVVPSSMEQDYVLAFGVEGFGKGFCP